MVTLVTRVVICSRRSSCEAASVLVRLYLNLNFVDRFGNPPASIKFPKKVSSGSWVVLCGSTYGNDETKSYSYLPRKFCTLSYRQLQQSGHIFVPSTKSCLTEKWRVKGTNVLLGRISLQVKWSEAVITQTVYEMVSSKVSSSFAQPQPGGPLYATPSSLYYSERGTRAVFLDHT